VLPARSTAVIERGSWTAPPIFPFIQDIGKIEDSEMYRAFNMGIGMALIVSPKDADDVRLRLKGLKESSDIIGFIESRIKGGDPVILS
jgi:phosphoribosylformylglycinamidine cyclo-ligase